MKIYLLAIGLFFQSAMLVANSSFSTSTNIVFIPRVIVDNNAEYTDIELLLRPDGTYSILSLNEETKQVPVDNSYPLRATIPRFDGLSTGTIFELESGQLWRVGTSLGYIDVSLNSLSVIIFKSGSDFKMSIDGTSETLDVHPFAYISKIESTIPNFGGLNKGTIFELANGDFWVVTQFPVFIVAHYVDKNLNVTIYELDNEYIMMVDGSPFSSVVELYQ